jgi:hypothetical protein
MRQVPNGKRARGRPGRNRPPNPRGHTFDSSGPEGKVRGTANQVFEKYLALARDAQSSGDRIAAENYYQHAEHYFRILNGGGQQVRPHQHMNGFPDEAEDNEGAEAEAAAAPSAPSPRPGSPAELAEAAAANQAEDGDDRSRRQGRRPPAGQRGGDGSFSPRQG